MKRDSELTINGYSIKKQGNLWIAKKGDFYHRSFNEQQLGRLIEKLGADSAVIVPLVKAPVDLSKKAVRAARKLEAKSVKEKAVADKAKAKQLAKEEAIAVKAEKKLAKQQKKNSVALEIFNLIAQSLAYFVWYLYFFTDKIAEYTESYIGDQSLWISLGIGLFALITHVLYVRQLGKKHRIATAISGFLMIIFVAAGLTYLNGGIVLSAITFDILLAELALTFTSLVNIVLISFMSIKWVLVLVTPKR